MLYFIQINFNKNNLNKNKPNLQKGDFYVYWQSIAKSKQCYVLLRIMRKIVKGKGKCDRQAVDAEFVIELDGEESKLFKEMFAELLK